MGKPLLKQPYVFIETYERNSNEKHYSDRRVSVTEVKVLEENSVLAEVINSANVIACYNTEPENHPLMAITKEVSSR